MTQEKYSICAKIGDEENEFMRDNSYPKDIDFQVLGLKPDTFDQLSVILTIEIQFGLLVILDVAAIKAQELINGKDIFVDLKVIRFAYSTTSYKRRYANLGRRMHTHVFNILLHITTFINILFITKQQSN